MAIRRCTARHRCQQAGLAAGYHPRMLKTQESRERWLFWIVAVLVLGAGLGLRDPWPADEPRFALVARQMVESGQWLFPMRGDELYPDKPPLFMWIQATFYALSGHLRIAFLLPSLLAALGTLWLVRDLGRRLWTLEAGTYAAWAVLFALQFTFQAKRAQIDPLVTLWITLSVYGLLRHLLRGPDWRMPTWRCSIGNMVTSCEPNSTRPPASGCSRPAMMRSMVVLPQPEGPSRTSVSPGLIPRSSGSSARVPSANVLAQPAS